MIKSFADKRTAGLMGDRRHRSLPPEIAMRAKDKLAMLDHALNIEDLRLPPSNRLELLRGDRTGQYSIRINDRWRICFIWCDGNAYEVEIIDYH
ncbi:MAG: type II toxin-antitoxin system RelE/ParE family toxin [Rhodospirillaceae bacterium]